MTLPNPDAATLCWSTGKAKTTATWSPMNDQSWSSFVHWLDPENPAATKEVKPYVGGTLRHGQRTQRTMERRFFLTLDADYADPEFPLDTSILLHDVPYVIHTTWRHLEEDSHRYRLVIPLDRAVTPNEYKELAWLVMGQLGGDQFDKTTAQAERFMWGPSAQDPDTYFWKSANAQARYLHVDAWLDGQHRVSDTPADAPGTQGTPTAPASHTGQHSAVEATDEDRERAVEILEGACEDIEFVNEKGEFAGRNEAVFHLMPLLFRFVEADLLDEDTVTDALWTAAQHVSADEPYSQTEFDASVRSARQYAEEQGPVLPETTPSRMAAADFEDVEMEEDLWSMTPRLQHVAQAADSMGRNRFALLATMLIRVLGEVSPGICLPGVQDGAIGSRAALNLGVALVGSSGQGKSTFIDESADLFGHKQGDIERSAATGQGLLQAYLTWDAEKDENVLIDDPRRIFVTDEIDKLGALGSDTGSTLLGELRTMLTGGSTGSTNATKERQRMLHARTYNFQLVVGVQPARAGVLLDGRDAGTPQRFIWTTVTDPVTALHPKDRPEWPGPLEWSDVFLLGFEFGEKVVDYPEWVKEELREYDYKVSLEGPEGGPMSRFGHQNLLRLKVAAGIAFLHESHVIEDLHIHMADIIVASSKDVQLGCEKVMAQTQFERKKSALSSDERARSEVGRDKLKQLIKNARARMMRSQGEWVRWQDLRPEHRDRAEWGEAVWEALEQDEDVETDEREHGSQVRRKARMT